MLGWIHADKRHYRTTSPTLLQFSVWRGLTASETWNDRAETSSAGEAFLVHGLALGGQSAQVLVLLMRGAWDA